jgi:histone deacetylase 6
LLLCHSQKHVTAILNCGKNKKSGEILGPKVNQ